MSVRNLLADIALICHTSKKDRLVGLLSRLNALRLLQRRAEAGQLQQRRVNFSGRKRSHWAQIPQANQAFSIISVLDAYFTLTLAGLGAAQRCAAVATIRRVRPCLAVLIEVDNDFH